MDTIRPVSDLRNNFAEISRIVHETAKPVFLTKNGYGDMVVLSMEAYENLKLESEVYFKASGSGAGGGAHRQAVFFQGRAGGHA